MDLWVKSGLKNWVPLHLTYAKYKGTQVFIPLLTFSFTAKTAFHNKKIIPTVKHGGSSVKVWVYLAVFKAWPRCHNWMNHEICSQPENLDREYAVISQWTNAQANLVYAATIRSTRASPPLNGSKETKLSFWSSLVRPQVPDFNTRFAVAGHKQAVGQNSSTAMWRTDIQLSETFSCSCCC